MNTFTKRFVFFQELFISFLHICMFVACYFRQRTYVALGFVYDATYVLWRKQQAGNIHVCKTEINNSWKNANLMADLFTLTYLLFSFWTHNKRNFFTYIYIFGFKAWLWCLFYVLECKGWILYSFGGGSYWSWGIDGCLWVCGRYLW